MTTQKTISPVDGSVYCERELTTDAAVDTALTQAREAQQRWRHTPLADRARICTAFCSHFEADARAIATELTWQMGRPVQYAPNEVRGTLERARHMIAIAPDALADIDAGPRDGFRRFLRRGGSRRASCSPSPPGIIPT